MQAGSSTAAKIENTLSVAHAKLKKTLNAINPLKTSDIVQTAEPKSKSTASAGSTADFTAPANAAAASVVTDVSSLSVIEVCVWLCSHHQ